MALDIGKWFATLKRGITPWRATVGSALAGLAAFGGWTAANVTAISESVDRLARTEASVRVERNTYADEFRSGDPGKRDFLNDVVFRVRMGVIAPEAGADLLCWLAARAHARSVTAGAVDATTADSILRFMNRHHEMFGLERGRLPWSKRRVEAEEYCVPYMPALQSQPAIAAAAETAESAEVETGAVELEGGIKHSSTGPFETSIADPGLLFLQVATETQRPDAVAAGRAVERAFPTIQYQGVERIETYEGPAEVRFYKPADRPMAETMAARLRCGDASPRVQRVHGYENSALVRDGTLELWIGPDVTGCRLTSR